MNYIAPFILATLTVTGCGAAAPADSAAVTAPPAMTEASPAFAPIVATTLRPAATVPSAVPASMSPTTTVRAASTTSTATTTTPVPSSAAPPRIVPTGEAPRGLPDDPVTPDEHDHDGPPASHREVAVAWVMERYTARSDEAAPDRALRLGALTGDATLAASPPPPAADVPGAATWPIDVSVTEISDTTWAVTFTLNESPAPPELATYDVVVTVVEGDVIAEDLQS